MTTKEVGEKATFERAAPQILPAARDEHVRTFLDRRRDIFEPREEHTDAVALGLRRPLVVDVLPRPLVVCTAWGVTCGVREEPGKQKPRNCWAQELAPK